jgi:hypothetical protein
MPEEPVKLDETQDAQPYEPPNRQRRKRRLLVWISTALLLAVIGTAVAYRPYQAMKREAMLTSCASHATLLACQDLSLYAEGHSGQLPFEKGLPGYEMLARFCQSMHPGEGGCNCHHGAPHCGFGGWQAVNLPPEKWALLLDKYKLPPSIAWWGRGIPFYWCGKPSGLGMRLVGMAHRSGDNEWWVINDRISEEDLKECVDRLNLCLAEIGEPPISLNVPDGVDWDRISKSGPADGSSSSPTAGEPPK